MFSAAMVNAQSVTDIIGRYNVRKHTRDFGDPNLNKIYVNVI